MSGSTEQPSQELWSSLRRRKVVQWGIAYVAAAWALLQGLAYLSTMFHWPAHLQRPVTTAFLVCLPIALVLAWYHGDRGQQRVSGREFTILIALLLLGGGLFWWVARLPDSPVVTPAGLQSALQAQVPATTGTSIAESVAHIDRYLAENMGIAQLVRSHPYLWLGDFDRAGAADDQISDALLSWERFPPGFRNSPGYKRKLDDKGVLAYWRTQGYPPQCRAVAAKDFTCD